MRTFSVLAIAGVAAASRTTTEWDMFADLENMMEDVATEITNATNIDWNDAGFEDADAWEAEFDATMADMDWTADMETDPVSEHVEDLVNDAVATVDAGEDMGIDMDVDWTDPAAVADWETAITDMAEDMANTDWMADLDMGDYTFEIPDYGEMFAEYDIDYDFDDMNVGGDWEDMGFYDAAGNWVFGEEPEDMFVDFADGDFEFDLDLPEMDLDDWDVDMEGDYSCYGDDCMEDYSGCGCAAWDDYSWNANDPTITGSSCGCGGDMWDDYSWNANECVGEDCGCWDEYWDEYSCYGPDCGDYDYDIDRMPEDWTMPVDMGSTRADSWHNWIGKYKFAGATDEWLDAMYHADYNNDGNVTFGEAIGACMEIGATVNEEVWDAYDYYGEDYDWSHDMHILTELLPLGFDHDRDGQLDWQETQDFFNAINQDHMAEDVFMAHATMGYEDLYDLVSTIRYDFDGEYRAGQFEGMTTFMDQMWDMDTNGDGIVSLREFIEGMKYAGFAQSVDTEMMIAMNGEDFDWINDHHLIAEVITADFNTWDYYSLYEMMEMIGMPWMTDEYLQGTSEHPNMGVGMDDIVDMIETFKWDHDGEWMHPTDEWVEIDDRLAESFKNWWPIDWDGYKLPHSREILYNGDDTGLWDDATEEAYAWLDGEMGDAHWGSGNIWDNAYVLGEMVVHPYIDHDAGLYTDHIDYVTAYDIFNKIGYPWILDTEFSGLFDIAEVGANHNAIAAFMESWMYDSDEWETTPPEDWLWIEDRLVPDYPWEPTEEMVTIYLREEIQKQIDRLWELDAQVAETPLDELDWEHHDDAALDDLSDLIFEVMDYADDEFVTVI